MLSYELLKHVLAILLGCEDFIQGPSMVQTMHEHNAFDHQFSTFSTSSSFNKKWIDAEFHSE